jgi:hypothetical protein
MVPALWACGWSRKTAACCAFRGCATAIAPPPPSLPPQELLEAFAWVDEHFVGEYRLPGASCLVVCQIVCP